MRPSEAVARVASANEEDAEAAVGLNVEQVTNTAVVHAGGRRADEHGYLIAPTVFEDVRDDAFLSCEEVFGPGSRPARLTHPNQQEERRWPRTVSR
jgi:acyl-CoA reductase-like NAD-dependent aldehyde dehydrogenase